MFPIPWNKLFRKKDGSIVTIDDAISSGGGGGYTLPTASSETKGGVKIGSGLSMNGEILNNSNPTPYSLPTASSETLGGVKVGSGLSIEDGVLSATGGGGGKIYYKTFTQILEIVSQISTSGVYVGRVGNIAVDGYTPIGVRVTDHYTGYTLNCGLSTYYVDDTHREEPCVEIYTTYGNTSKDFARPITVYYVANNDLVAIPT